MLAKMLHYNHADFVLLQWGFVLYKTDTFLVYNQS